MATKSSASVALFIFINLLFFALVTSCPCTNPPPTPKPTPSPKPKPTPSPKPKPTPSPSPSGSSGKCPRDTLKLAACADLLGLAHVVVGSSATKPCCSLLEGLADLDAAVCLCTAIKANVLGLHLNVPVSLSLLLNACGRVNPSKYKCA